MIIFNILQSTCWFPILVYIPGFGSQCMVVKYYSSTIFVEYDHDYFVFLWNFSISHSLHVDSQHLSTFQVLGIDVWLWNIILPTFLWNIIMIVLFLDFSKCDPYFMVFWRLGYNLENFRRLTIILSSENNLGIFRRLKNFLSFEIYLENFSEIEKFSKFCN